MQFNQSIVTEAGKKGIDRRSLEELFKNKKIYNEVLASVLEVKIDSLEKTEASVGNFESPNWAVKEAFILGKKNAYNEIWDIITPKEVDNE